MSKQSLIFAIIVFIAIAGFIFWYFLPKSPAIVPPSAEQAQRDAVIKELNSFKPDPATAKTSEEITKELNSFKPAKNAPLPADILNELNSVKP